MTASQQIPEDRALSEWSGWLGLVTDMVHLLDAFALLDGAGGVFNRMKQEVVFPLTSL